MEAEMSKAKAFSILAVLILALGACKPQPVVSSALTAALSELQGVVDIRPSGEGDFTPATTESVLGVDGQIQTGDDGRVRLDLSSGTIVRVAPSSLFTLAANEQVEGGLATRIKLELGEVFIILNGGSAEVETPSGMASVRGSYMRVQVDPDTGDVIVTCLEGACSASNPSGTVEFSAGEKVILYQYDEGRGAWIAPGVEPMSPEDYEEWLEGNPETRELYNRAMATGTALAEPTLQEALPTVLETIQITLEVPELTLEVPPTLPVIPQVTPELPPVLPKLPEIEPEVPTFP
jgi:hypothetical protein